MALSVVEICNMALTRLGAERISDIEADGVLPELCNQFYAVSRDEITKEYEWSFATQRKILASITATDEDPNLSEFLFRHQMPSDPVCLKLLSLIDATTETFKDIPGNWAIEGDRLFNNEEVCGVRYIKVVDEPALLPIDFCLAISLRLALHMCVKVTQDMNLFSLIAQEYQVALLNAKMNDGGYTKKSSTAPESWS